MNQTKKEVHVLMYQYYNESDELEYAIDVDDANAFEPIVSQKVFPTLKEINAYVNEETKNNTKYKKKY